MSIIEIKEKYNKYINEHCENVKNAYEWLIKNNVIEDKNYLISIRIFMHDDSKHSKYEFDQYADYFYGERTEQVNKDFDYAWLHHIHCNKHHWQHW